MEKLTKQQLAEMGLIGVRSAKHKVVKEADLKNKVTELSVHNAVCKYLKLQYPGVMFLSDFGAGIKLSHGMADRQSMQKSNHAFPDIMIFEPRGGYYGLFIEIKRNDDIYKKNGDFKKNEHIYDQIICRDLLNSKGYLANFGCGFDECKQIIDNYFLTPFKQNVK